MTSEPTATILGRLLAVLEHHHALVTQPTRAYELAVISPASILVPGFARLTRAGHDAVEPLMTQIAEFPRRALTAEEQAQFAVGYYQQRARGRRDKYTIKARREAMGYTQEAFAEKLQVPLSTLRSWEQARREPRIGSEVLTRLADLEQWHASPSGHVGDTPIFGRQNLSNTRVQEAAHTGEMPPEETWEQA